MPLELMPTTFGQRLRYIRKRVRGMTLEEVAQPRYTKGFLSLLENDKAQPSSEALEYLAKKLEVTRSQLLGEPGETHRLVQVLLTRSRAFRLQGDLDGAVKAATDALEALNLAPELVLRGECELALGLVALQREALEDAAEPLERAHDDFERAAALDRQAETKIHLGRLAHRQKDLERAREHYEKSLALVDRTTHLDVTVKLRLFAALGSVSQALGDAKEATSWYEKGVELAEQINDPREAARLYMNLGQVYQERGDLGSALRFGQKALDMLQAEDERSLVADMHNNIGWLYASQDRWDQALPHYEESLRLRRQDPGSVSRSGYTYAELARYYLRVGRLGEAEEYGTNALRLVKGENHLEEEGDILSTLAGVHAARGRRSEAEALYRQAAMAFAEEGLVERQAEMLSTIGQMWNTAGEPGRANAALLEAVGLLQRSMAARR
ncbi:MAG: helix-turn-helix domain-containing protein [Symbiobacteriia bacterium]